jgi:hypothetical protein
MVLAAAIVMGLGAVALLASLGVALARRPRLAPLDEDHDTILFEPIGPPDGQLIRIEGKVVVHAPMRAPGGADCALYELYAGRDGEPARALRQKGVRFSVDDGIMPVWIDPAYKLVTFDLPAEVVDVPASDDRVLIVRHLQPGDRVEVVGRVWRSGAPGHEEVLLLPPNPRAGVTITYLG